MVLRIAIERRGVPPSLQRLAAPAQLGRGVLANITADPESGPRSPSFSRPCNRPLCRLDSPSSWA